MAGFELTPAAEIDLLNIAYFGMERFGVAQFELYRDKLYQRFQEGLFRFLCQCEVTWLIRSEFQHRIQAAFEEDR